MTRKTPLETRTKLLQATIQLITTDGANHLTLEAVAREAQVSKGGLLHHFATKEALFRGLIDLATQSWNERFADELAHEPEGQTGRWSRAYIRATFDREADETRLMLALTRVVAAYPDLIDVCRAIYAQPWEDAADDGLPEARALTIQVACDGLWLGEMAGIPLVPDALRAQVRAELLRLTQ